MTVSAAEAEGDCGAGLPLGGLLVGVELGVGDADGDELGEPVGDGDADGDELGEPVGDAAGVVVAHWAGVGADEFAAPGDGAPVVPGE